MTCILLSGDESPAAKEEGAVAYVQNLEHHWPFVGADARDFIQNLLVKDENTRFSARQCLKHPWISKSSYSDRIRELYRLGNNVWQPRSSNSRQIIEKLNLSSLEGRPKSVSSNDGSEIDRESRQSPVVAPIESHDLLDGLQDEENDRPILKRPRQAEEPTEDALNASPVSSVEDHILPSSSPQAPLRTFNPNQVGLKEFCKKPQTTFLRTSKAAKHSQQEPSFRHVDRKRVKIMDAKDALHQGDGFDGTASGKFKSKRQIAAPKSKQPKAQLLLS